MIIRLEKNGFTSSKQAVLEECCNDPKFAVAIGSTENENRIYCTRCAKTVLSILVKRPDGRY